MSSASMPVASVMGLHSTEGGQTDQSQVEERGLRPVRWRECARAKLGAACITAGAAPVPVEQQLIAAPAQKKKKMNTKNEKCSRPHRMSRMNSWAQVPAGPRNSTG